MINGSGAYFLYVKLVAVMCYTFMRFSHDADKLLQHFLFSHSVIKAVYSVIALPFVTYAEYLLMFFYLFRGNVPDLTDALHPYEVVASFYVKEQAFYWY